MKDAIKIKYINIINKQIKQKNIICYLYIVMNYQKTYQKTQKNNK